VRSTEQIEALERAHQAELAAKPMTEAEAAAQLPSVRVRVEAKFSAARLHYRGPGPELRNFDLGWTTMLAGMGGRPHSMNLNALLDFERRLDEMTAERQRAQEEAAAAQAEIERQRHAFANSLKGKTFVSIGTFTGMLDGQMISLERGWSTSDVGLAARLLRLGAPLYEYLVDGTRVVVSNERLSA
jgi:hypothetical protein